MILPFTFSMFFFYNLLSLLECKTHFGFYLGFVLPQEHLQSCWVGLCKDTHTQRGEKKKSNNGSVRTVKLPQNSIETTRKQHQNCHKTTSKPPQNCSRWGTEGSEAAGCEWRSFHFSTSSQDFDAQLPSGAKGVPWAGDEPRSLNSWIPKVLEHKLSSHSAKSSSLLSNPGNSHWSPAGLGFISALRGFLEKIQREGDKCEWEGIDLCREIREHWAHPG